jgi:NAD-dependent dihydropyrimidine dehydrogenase PreA subunit
MISSRLKKKAQPPGFLIPIIDWTKCEGGYHFECKEKHTPCIAACPESVLEIRRLTAFDKKGLSFGERLRIFVHRNRQAYAVKPQACIACGECIIVCPVHAIKLRRAVSTPHIRLA